MHKLPLIVMFLLLTSCSLAPFSTTKTASSLGKGKMVLDTGFSPVPYGRFERGITDNFDFGASIEDQSGVVINLDAKYSLINNPEGFSFALLGGVFYGFDLAETKGVYAAPIFSIKNGWFEAYLSSRYNYVKWEGSDYHDSDDFFVTLFSYDDIAFSYLESSFGMNFWFKNDVAFNINVKHFYFIGDDVSDSEANFMPGLGFIFKF